MWVSPLFPFKKNPSEQTELKVLSSWVGFYALSFKKVVPMWGQPALSPDIHLKPGLLPSSVASFCKGTASVSFLITQRCAVAQGESFFYFLIFIYGCVGSSFLCEGFFQLQQAGATHSSPRCAGLSPSRPLPLQSTGSRRAGSVVVAHGLSRSAACGILPDQGSNPCPLHWQADSQPLRHQGSPRREFLNGIFLSIGDLILSRNTKQVL